MKMYEIRYWNGGATIKIKVYRANSIDKAREKFYKYNIGEILGIEEV